MTCTSAHTKSASGTGFLADLAPGMEGRILGFRGDCPLRRRLLDLGFVPGTLIKCTARSPLGDPSAYLIRRTVIALRRADARCVEVSFETPPAISETSSQQGGHSICNKKKSGPKRLSPSQETRM